MANTIGYASIFQPELDRQMVAEASSGWMEVNAAMVRYNGGSEVKVPSIVMDGLGDYNRDTGFVKGSVTLSWETHPLTQDRGRTFSIDAMDVDESNFVATAGAVMGEFQRTKVAPEVDAYRYSRIATLAISKSKASGGYTPAASTILGKLRGDIAAIQDEIGEGAPLVVTLPIPVAAVLDNDETIKKQLDVVDFSKGEVTMKVKALDGIPLLRAPSARMKTAYVFQDGTTSGQTAGGFVVAESAKSINWLITARSSVVAISKTDLPRIFDPMTNQTANAWKIDYRKYHDLWIPKNKFSGVWANIKESLE